MTTNTCGAPTSEGYVCTKEKGHDGRHAHSFTMPSPSLPGHEAPTDALDALAETWAARIVGNTTHPSIASTAECVCRHGQFWGECFECCKAALLTAFRSARASRPSSEPGERARALEEAGRAVVDAYGYCRERGSFSGFWSHIDDLAKTLDGSLLPGEYRPVAPV